MHVFHVVPSPKSGLLGAGIGLADAGEFMVAPPDPSDDKKQVLSIAYDASVRVANQHSYCAQLTSCCTTMMTID